MKFPKLTDEQMLQRLAPPTGKVEMVLDTDTYNEVDDQFALAYALLSPDRMDVQAVYAAPFHNNRSDGPGDGMEKSFAEILRVLDKMDIDRAGDVFKGATTYLPAANEPVVSPAAEDLVKKAMAAEDLLYVLPIGAPTNVASAILLEPEIIEKIVVVWLGGQPVYHPTAREFNLKQDLLASQLLFDCGAPFVQIPCTNVAEHLRTTIPELEACIKGRSELGTYLFEIVRDYTGDPWGWSKVIWDISAVAWLINAEWVPGDIVHAPILTDNCTYSLDNRRHLMRVATHCSRDAVFRDLFAKLNELP